MGRRALGVLGLAAAGGLAWWLSRREGGPIYAPISLDYIGAGAGLFPLVATTVGTGYARGGDYFAKLARAEDPNGGLYTKNPYSSASGLYGFTKGTWTALGGDWGSDPSKAFGGLRPSREAQDAMAAKLTAGNAAILQRAGQAASDASLYAIHILGPGDVFKVIAAPAGASLASVIGAGKVAKNPALGQTVASFWRYVNGKVG